MIAVGLYLFATHKSGASKASLAAGYESQSLAEPFVFDNKAWNDQAGTWKYLYSANVGVAQAVYAAKSQLGSRGYQVDARRPDTVDIKSNTTTLYRDLITEDVALAVQIYPNPAATPDNPSAAPSIATVTVSPMQGN